MLFVLVTVELCAATGFGPADVVIRDVEALLGSPSITARQYIG